MDYLEWIERERRARSRLLKDSPPVDGKRRVRVCRVCGEFCLCHEETCPNCGGNDIALQDLVEATAEVFDGNRIRCRFRYDQLEAAGGGRMVTAGRLYSGFAGGKA